MPISNRERFKQIARFQRPGDLFTEDTFWPGVFADWVKQGAPKELAPGGPEIYANSFVQKYFGFDTRKVITGVKAGWSSDEIVDLGNGIAAMGGSPLVPGYAIKIITEDERTFTFTNGSGQTMKVLKNKPAMPMFLGWPVKDRKTWNEHKKKLDPNTPARWCSDWNEYAKKLNSDDTPTILQVGGFFGPLRNWIGSENILYMFYDDPALIEEMMDQVFYLHTEIIKRVVKTVKVDEADFWEDMAYKGGPLISPDMVKKYMVPRYKKMTELLRSSGIDIIYVDSDGDIEKLIPLFVESGINYVWPLEQACGNDPVAIRKKYGTSLTLGGGIDKRALAKGKKVIREEVMSKVPFLLGKGGYFPSVDHNVPPDVSFENYCYYINTLREVAGLAKLPF